MIVSIQEETERRRRRIRSFRREGVGGVGEVESTSEEIVSRRVYPVGIMTVRTMEESLAPESDFLLGKDDSSLRSKNFRIRRRKLIRKLSAGLPEAGVITGNANSTISSISSSCSGLSKGVTFSTISIREFPLVPGDNPSVSRGPPICFAWDFVGENNFDLYDYESVRGTRRTQIQMKIPAQIRSKLLLDNGHRWRDIQSSIKAANISRRQRQQSISRIHADEFDEKMEKLSRGVKKIFKKKKQKKKRQSLDYTGNEMPDFNLETSSSTEKMQENENDVDDIDISYSNSAKKYDLDLELDPDLSISSTGNEKPITDVDAVTTSIPYQEHERQNIGNASSPEAGAEAKATSDEEAGRMQGKENDSGDSSGTNSTGPLVFSDRSLEPLISSEGGTLDKGINTSTYSRSTGTAGGNRFLGRPPSQDPAFKVVRNVSFWDAQKGNDVNKNGVVDLLPSAYDDSSDDKYDDDESQNNDTLCGIGGCGPIAVFSRLALPVTASVKPCLGGMEGGESGVYYV